MYEVIPLSERCFYIDCPAKIGVWRTDDAGVVLIDSGNSKDTGRKIKRILDERGWQLRAIVCTHGHADHIGGAHYLQANTGCRVFAGGIDADLTRHTILNPALLYGGNPGKELRHRFLLAQECEVTDLSAPAFPEELTVLPLPGHTPDMIGLRTPDGVVFLGDCVSSVEALEKYGIWFLFDVGAFLATLDRVSEMEAECFVPSHAPASSDIGELVRRNRESVLSVGETITALCREPVTFEELLRQIFRTYRLTMTFEQHALIGSTVRSYLTWLENAGRIAASIEDDRLLWRAAE